MFLKLKNKSGWLNIKIYSLIIYYEFFVNLIWELNIYILFLLSKKK